MTRLVVTHPQPASARQWAEALARSRPELEIVIDEPGLSSSARWALGWQAPEDFFERHRDIEAFFSAGAGIDHLLNHPGLPEDIALYRLEDAGMGQQMADYCLHAVLRAFLHVDHYEAAQKRTVWQEARAESRGDWPIGLVGYGQLGRAIADALSAQGFIVQACTRSEPRGRTGAEPIPVHGGEPGLNRILADSRILVIAAPLTPQTRGLIDARALARLRRGAWLINVARGAIVDESALLNALDRGHLAGAQLDVFCNEPLAPRHAFWEHPKIRITPHVAAATLIEPGAIQVARAIEQLGAGMAAGGRVDRSLGY